MIQIYLQPTFVFCLFFIEPIKSQFVCVIWLVILIKVSETTASFIYVAWCPLYVQVIKTMNWDILWNVFYIRMCVVAVRWASWVSHRADKVISHFCICLVEWCMTNVYISYLCNQSTWGYVWANRLKILRLVFGYSNQIFRLDKFGWVVKYNCCLFGQLFCVICCKNMKAKNSI